MRLIAGLLVCLALALAGCGATQGHPIIEQHQREAKESRLEAKVCAIPKAEAAALGHLEVWEATCE